MVLARLGAPRHDRHQGAEPRAQRRPQCFAVMRFTVENKAAYTVTEVEDDGCRLRNAKVLVFLRWDSPIGHHHPGIKQKFHHVLALYSCHPALLLSPPPLNSPYVSSTSRPESHGLACPERPHRKPKRLEGSVQHLRRF